MWGADDGTRDDGDSCIAESDGERDLRGGVGGPSSSSQPLPHPAMMSYSSSSHDGGRGGEDVSSYRDDGVGRTGSSGGGKRRRDDDDRDPGPSGPSSARDDAHEYEYDDDDDDVDVGIYRRAVVRGPIASAVPGGTMTMPSTTGGSNDIDDNGHRNANAKSVRRRRKMYSDFVGVTYNKTHAKYQACITHYRRQHYLGRYRLAVDAALAYDESARLLKGSSWKVNFRNRREYEAARDRELGATTAATAGVGGRANGVDDDMDPSMTSSMSSRYYYNDGSSSLAAVATKVGEIASAVARGAFKGPDGGGVGPPAMTTTMPTMMRGLLQPVGSEAHRAGYLWHEGPRCIVDEGHGRGRGISVTTTTGDGVRWAAQATSGGETAPMSRPQPRSSGVATEKVTPSPTLPIAIVHGNMEEEVKEEDEVKKEWAEEVEGGDGNEYFPVTSENAALLPGVGGEPTKMPQLGTPYPVSPNPAKHALGNEKGTPDSVIRPTVLTYRRGEMDFAPCHSRRSEEACDVPPPSLYRSPSLSTAASGCVDNGKGPSLTPRDQTRIAIEGDDDCRIDYQGGDARVEPATSGGDGGASLPSSRSPTMLKTSMSTAISASPMGATAVASAPPMIQNGTLAAASALMTLFGKERGSPPQG
jgi:hypothetical protein